MRMREQVAKAAYLGHTRAQARIKIKLSAATTRQEAANLKLNGHVAAGAHGAPKQLQQVINGL